MSHTLLFFTLVFFVGMMLGVFLPPYLHYLKKDAEMMKTRSRPGSK